jgi:AcrR family transcriptional regulator
LTDKREEIKKCAKELFSEKGFKDTNIAEVTKLAGVATGTFYNYYPSKDKLFMELFLEENVKHKKKILERIDMAADPLTVINQMMFENQRGFAENPILKEWFNKEVFQRIEKCYREENGIEYSGFLYDFFLDVVKKWQAEGKVRDDIPPDMMMAIFSALVNIDTHKDEVGLQYFPDVLNYLSEFTMKALMDCAPKS